MAKFLFEASYTLDGVRGLLDEGGTARNAAVKAAAEGNSVKALILRSVEKELTGAGSKRGRIKPPIVSSRRPDSRRLTNDQVYDLIPFP